MDVILSVSHRPVSDEPQILCKVYIWDQFVLSALELDIWLFLI